jgi:hypothetical protein
MADFHHHDHAAAGPFYRRELQASGATSLRAIAAGLDGRNIPTARGGEWSATQVARLLEDIERPFDVAA